MSSRQEEKEKRRREREAAERAAQASAARRKRMGMVGGGVLVAAILVIVALAAFSGGDDGGDGGGGDGDGGGGTEIAAVAAPTQNVRNLQDAAKAAGCKLATSRDEGAQHVTTPVKYGTNPPTSGNHSPVPAEDIDYSGSEPPSVESTVHSLEHGRVNIQYRPGSPRQRIAQLKSVFEEDLKGESGYHALLFQNQTKMTGAVAATAWTQSLTCPQWNDQVFDAVRTFRRTYTDKGPEFIP